MTTIPVMDSFSYGGGVQSNAALVLLKRAEIECPVMMFANVGDDSEHPATLEYVRKVAIPYARANGIEIIELRRVPKKGASAGQCFASDAVPEPADHDGDEIVCPSCGVRFPAGEIFPVHNRAETLRGRLMREGSRSLPIPVRMSNGAPGRRSCTADFKIRVVADELKRRGATKENPAVVGLGISVDEIQRAKPGLDRLIPSQIRTYPLLDLGLSRADCLRIIESEGLPQPPKSACYFCPFHDKEAWRKLKRETPDLFEDARHIEETLNDRRAMLGKDSVWLTRFAKPLDQVVDDQLTFDVDDDCDSGFCFT